MDVELANYYLNNRWEFAGEDGHNKLLTGLKTFTQPISGVQVVGIDVGGCVGNYLKNITDICSEPNTQILCFEPNPINTAALEKKIDVGSNIKLFKHCVSNETGVVPFYNWKENMENTEGNGIAGLRSGGSKICDTEVKRLDDVLDAEFKDDIVIKFIKIDTEGNDTNVIKSIGKYLRQTMYIIFECSDCLDDSRGPGIKNPMKDIVDFLSANGFDTYRIGTRKLIKVNDEYWNQVYDDVKFWSDCFACKKGDSIMNKLIDNEFGYKF